jgi:hypothetical protein
MDAALCVTNSLLHLVRCLLHRCYILRLQARHGNVVVFLGGEGPLSRPQRPIIFENAKRLHALVIQIEHR